MSTAPALWLQRFSMMLCVCVCVCVRARARTASWICSVDLWELKQLIDYAQADGSPNGANVIGPSGWAERVAVRVVA